MVDEREKPRSRFAERSRYLAALLDSLEDQISVIDRDGVIHYTNLAWDLFAEQNGMPKGYDWIGVNYTEVCDRADEPLAQSAVEGIRRVLRRIQEKFCLEYPCHSPDTQRWFMMRVAPVVGIDAEFYAIAHTYITERKLLELEVASLSQHDPLTGLANRRLFNRFLHNEWRRSMREQTPLSLIMLDLDNFKACNDHLGHQMGDGSLQLVGHLLQSFCQRPADLPCRFGGDEFALILGNTDRDAALRIGEAIRQAINELDIVAAGELRLSASIGIATYTAEQPLAGEGELLAAADAALYCAKGAGKNRSHCANC
ncbi:GGDEF domain-containing protein [Aeromonas allosaccharophila]|uniref:sensor domain-containing diguanylate cyclase n=1 Tax=Aeromonas allosaccharophila TaxID=656 RepID=UPI0013CA5E9B|nr:sensor domain-containing diguanylate cyclase [Aeromonas allosaccharophila]WDO01306.1 GGDEF domain-containing protein [Aeromonas allosaccharophila]